METMVFLKYLFPISWRNESTPIEIPNEVLKNLNTELTDILSKGKKFEAIKQYRKITGLGLKESKEYIDLLSSERTE